MAKKELSFMYASDGGPWELRDVVFNGISLSAVSADSAEPESVEEWRAEAIADDRGVLGREVVDFIDNQLNPKFRPYVVRYLTHCVIFLKCTVEVPDVKVKNYLNIYPPRATHVRRRLGGLMITPSSSRLGMTGLGDIDLSEFDEVVPTYENGKYVYPKIPMLDSDERVDEAIRLSQLALLALER